MTNIMQLVEGAEKPTDIAGRLLRESHAPEMFDLLSETWPEGTLVIRPSSIADFLERPLIRMARVSTFRMMCDLWELAMPAKAQALMNFCYEAPQLLAAELNTMFPREQRQHVRVMPPELYPQLEGFEFGVCMATAVYYDGEYANWQKEPGESAVMVLPPHSLPPQKPLEDKEDSI